MKVFLRDDIAALWCDQDPFEAAESLAGEIFREVKERRTLRFETSAGSYFIKLHRGVGWIEILKNLLSGRRPVVSARQEFDAISKLTDLGVQTMTVAAFGERGSNPARRHSFLITDALENTISLETLCARWPESRPTFRFKQQLIDELARISRLLHSNGVCHRDYYLCHFLLRCAPDGSVDETSPPHLSLIDLHRALIRPSLHRRWKEKDIAGLHFSSLEAGLTRTDRCRFVVAYTGLPLREALHTQASFWRAVEARAMRTWERDQRKLARRNLAGTSGAA